MILIFGVILVFSVYVPVEDLSSITCYQIIDKDTIRVFTEPIIIGSSSSYDDFFINSHYMKKSDSKIIELEDLSSCQQLSRLTNDYKYRSDFVELLVLCIILGSFLLILPYYIISSIWKKRKF